MIQRLPLDETIRRVTFISDLHLMSARSSAESYRETIALAIEGCDLCVWGGDLFDFRWSRLSSESESISAALEWLDDWYQNYPTKQFVFLNGNHDAHRTFRTELSDWSRTRDRFECGLECLRIDNTIWLHGDVIEGDGSNETFARYRQTWQDKPVANSLQSGIYDAAVNVRVHKAAAAAAHRRRSTCRRLIRWLRRQPANQTDGVRRIVFGHTHRPIYHYRLGQFEFYNGGAAIRHVAFHPVTLDLA